MLNPLPISTPLLRPSVPDATSGRARERGVPFKGGSLIEMLDYRAAAQPNDLAYTFLRDGEFVSSTLTWSQLALRSRAIAGRLQQRLVPGDRALLLYPPGLDFIAAFFGCIYAGVLAVPVQPPQAGRARRGIDRLQSIARDADARCTLTTADLRVSLDASLTTRTGTNDLLNEEAEHRWLATDSLPDTLADDWRPVAATRHTLAFLQYTSGSTAQPKGVMVSHGNLLHNLEAACLLGDTRSDSVSVSWLPVTHDMGLIEGVLQPAFSGCPAYLMSPGSFLQRPARWLRAISTYRATRSGGPNFAFELAVTKVSDADREGLDLSNWRAAYNGAEPVRADTMRSFTRTFAASGFKASAFRPCYGLAESTLLVTTERWNEAPDSVVSCGTPSPGLRVRIVDPVSQLECADGDIGEIQVAGESVAGGYWNRPHETAGVFVDDATSGNRWLRTGDLGRRHDDRLFVTGRIKDLLIVRGAKHYPQDLELTAERLHPAIRRGSVVAVAVANGIRGDRVALIAEVNPRGLDTGTSARLLVDLRAAIAETHGIQLHGIALVAPGTVPRTTSGKLQRFLCRDAWVDGSLDAIAYWSEESRGAVLP